MNRKNIHVVPNKSTETWSAKRENSNKPIATGKTQAGVIKAVTPTAREQQAELIIHRVNGKIRDRTSYGNDPCPPKDQK